MGLFTDELDVTPYDDESGTWKLLQSFIYDVNEDEAIEVPVGYVTDFATIPRVFWSILPPWGTYGKATVVHDYLCTDKRITNLKTNEVRLCSRKEADKVFLEAMTVLNVNVVVRYVMFAAVRVYAIISNKT